LDGDESRALKQHLYDCPVCQSFTQAEDALDDHFGQAVRNVFVPDDLSARLLTRLQADRRTWYRRRAWIPGVAAAACIGLATWLALPGGSRRPAPDLDFQALNAQLGAPLDQVEAWFRDHHHLTIVAPPQFDYNLLNFYGVAEFQGKQVPMLLFMRDADSARVYILNDSQFDLSKPPEQHGRYPIAYLRHPSNPRVAYVVVYTGESIHRFLDLQSHSA
jgi:hypothetical protein